MLAGGGRVRGLSHVEQDGMTQSFGVAEAGIGRALPPAGTHSLRARATPSGQQPLRPEQEDPLGLGHLDDPGAEPTARHEAQTYVAPAAELRMPPDVIP